MSSSLSASNYKSLPLLVLLGVMLILAACQPAAGVEIQAAWARQAEIGTNSAVYLNIFNGGDSDRLLDARTSVAEEVQLHRSLVDDSGVVSMQQQGSVDLPAGTKLSFEPGGYHLMLLNLQRDLVPGDRLKVTLIFENHDPISIDAEIRSP